MLPRLFTLVLALTLAACSAQPRAPLASASIPAGAATPEQAQSAPAQLAPLADLVRAVDIPYESFTLPNGLTTIVHTDRKAPVVGVTVYYRIGSKHEPRGRTGFAHLYEHIFFLGSENVPNVDKLLEAAGSSPTNGSTFFDRTNYVVTVPKGALDLALFMESDRMGHLLSAVTQDKLDKQRGVVQNEKRQGDNNPYGLMNYAASDGLFPVGHPYRHATIGSMADLDAATLEDVRQWFRDHYGPNNAVLALTGDVDMATARPLVERYFGGIPRGPDVRKVEAGPHTLPARIKREMTDAVPVTRITRNWTGPGLSDPDAIALEAGTQVLGGLASSRLDNALVRGEQLAVRVTAGAQTLEQVGFIEVTMDIKPGIDRAKAEARFDALIAEFIEEGPSADELRRAVTGAVSSQIDALEVVGDFGGKGVTLAEGQLYSGNPAQYKADLARAAALTPTDVRAAMQRWMTRPSFDLAVVPGTRTENGDTMGGWGDEVAGKPASRAPVRTRAARIVPGPKRTTPAVAPVGDLDFPAIERAQLSNGIPVALARRRAVPKLVLNLAFDAGYGADAVDGPGTQGFMMAMLEEGTTSRSSTAIAEEKERLGADISLDSTLDQSSAALSALTANLAPSLELLADIVRRPAFDPGEVTRLQGQRLAELAQTLADPNALASRELGRILFGAHPYGQPGDGLGNAEAIKALTPDALRKAHAAWLRPDKARITAAGDITMAELLPLLERAFGTWQSPAGPAPVKSLAAAVPAPKPRVVVIDRPDSPQSVIYAGRVLPLTGKTPDMEALALANELLGGGFLSRLNLDLREEKAWSYGVGSGVSSPAGPRTLMLAAPVQSDRTGDAIRALLGNMRAFPGTKPITAEEFKRITDGNIRSLPGSFQTNSQVVSAMIRNELLGRPDNFYSTLASRYRAIDAAQINAMARAHLQPDGLTFVVVGERKLVEPQLKGIGLPVEFVTAPDAGS